LQKITKITSKIHLETAQQNPVPALQSLTATMNRTAKTRTGSGLFATQQGAHT
jgi:hypothetical protein